MNEHSDMDDLYLDQKFDNERDRSDQPFLEDNASESFAPSTKRIFFVSFLVLLGVGGTLAWRSYNTNMSRAAAPSLAELSPASTTKPAALPVSAGELQQQLKSIASDLAAVRNTLEQQSAANHDQLTRIQEQISRQSIALLSSSPLADKPVQTPLPKPAQHPAHVSTQDSSKPIQVARPQSLSPPKQ